jgi:hypothetical protein
VTPGELHRAGLALADSACAGRLPVPQPAVDPEWLATDALESMAAATADWLARTAADARAVADALRRAARAYERCDHDAAERVRAASRGADL